MVAALMWSAQAAAQAVEVAKQKLGALVTRHQHRHHKATTAGQALRQPTVEVEVAAVLAQSVAPQQTQAEVERAARAVPRPSLAQAPTMREVVAGVQQLLQPLLVVQVVVAMAHSLTTSQQWLARLTQVVAGAVVI